MSLGETRGLRGWRRVVAVVTALALYAAGGCQLEPARVDGGGAAVSAAGGAVGGVVPATVSPDGDRAQARPAVLKIPRPAAFDSQDLGPSVLLPRAAADDREVINVGGVSVRKSHLYDRLFEHDPLWTKQEVDRIVFDILLAKAAREASIFVDVKMVDASVAAAESRLEKQIKADWGIKMTLDRFLLENRGISRPLYRQLSRRRVARSLLRYYVVRYLAGREERVRVRIISHRNRETMRRIHEKVRDGADFRSLALRESEHSTQRRGGLLPALSRASKAIYTKPAFTLKPGQVSPVLSATSNGVTYFYILYCVERIPGRNLPFKEVKSEIDADRIKNPLTEEEKLDLYERLRSASESLPKPGKKG